MKKYFYTLIYILCLNTQSVIAQEYSRDLSTYVVTAAACGATAYTLGKVTALYKQYTLPDASDNVKAFANAHTSADIPLKVGKRWAMHGDSFIEMPTQKHDALNNHLKGTPMSEQELSLIKWALLHEKKHYDNQDFKKGYLIFGLLFAMPIAYALHNHDEPIDYLHSTLLTSIAGLSLVSYSRQREKQADHYANMNMLPAELDHIATYWDQKASSFEQDLPNKSLYKTCPDSQKGFLAEIYNLFKDWKHPSDKSRAQQTQQCLNIRKKYPLNPAGDQFDFKALKFKSYFEQVHIVKE